MERKTMVWEPNVEAANTMSLERLTKLTGMLPRFKHKPIKKSAVINFGNQI